MIKFEKKKKMIVNFQNDQYDLTEFVHKHPGGVNSLYGLDNKDMTERFSKAPQHSKAALYLMNEYKVIINKDDMINENSLTLKKNGVTNTQHNNDNNNNKNGLINHNKINGISKNINDDIILKHRKNNIIYNNINNDNNSINNNDNKNNDDNNSNNNNDDKTNNNTEESSHFNDPLHIETDESMEHLVDWSKAMVPQIYKLDGEQYDEWVNKPVDRKLRLLGPSWLENLTKTPWWVVPIYWIPIIIYYMYIGYTEEILLENRNLLTFAMHILLGALNWTFIEYTLHRWVFHVNSKNTHSIIRTFHFLLHGQHHKVPFDELRLVFPPIPATILAITIYQPFRILYSCPRVALTGGLIGYVIYDLIHYYIHYGSPNGGHLYHMKRYHFQHHFVHHDKGFGISSQLWDNMFGTKIILRKLRYLLKW